MSNKAKIIQLDVCPRKCGGCRDSDHHWIDQCDEGTGEPQQACKHCDATREYPDEDPDDQEYLDRFTE